MKRRIVVLVQSIMLAALFVLPSYAQDDKALKKDLTSVIALQSLPCGEVVEVKTQKENDYLVTCKDKNKYHVFLNEKGRVVVEKIKEK